ncbi:MAG: hypothetical protein N2652_08530 [Kiritimatiellae bacterium]|nr:hypothetical protein [Kiritimatiellia bacterium]
MGGKVTGWFGALLAAVAMSAVAQDIVVRKGAAAKATVDWSGFSAPSSGAAATLLQVARQDLERSGWFRTVSAGAEFRISGECAERGGQLAASVVLTDAGRGAVALSRTYSAEAGQARALAHRIADDIVKAATGREGFASSRLVLVGNRTGRKELYVCDSDGHNLLQLTQDRSISLYPRWGANNAAITYTSYLRGYPAAFRIELASGRREMLAGFPGLNTGAVLSPDGRSCALILSREGNPELYVQTPPGGPATRITRTPNAAESSPTWSPDGSRIAFVSDLSGKPQVYVVSRAGGAPQRVTSRGIENVAPCWGPDGRIAYACRLGARFQICVVDPATGAVDVVTPEDADYEDPSWARNGRHIACARTSAHRSSIVLIDTVSREQIPLVSGSGDWFSPDWSK